MHQQPGLRSSSADPFVLSTYVTNAAAVTTTLSQKAAELTAAAEALMAAGETIPGLADFVAAVTDLAGDWYHLDEFTGDVANGFLATLEPGYRPDGSPMILTVDDRTLDDLGGIGFADRDEAVAAAEELAADYQVLLDAVADGDPLVSDPPRSDGAELSLEQIERMAGLLEGYGDDPAFTVAFTEALGVNGVIGLRDMYLTYAREARDVDRSHGHHWTDDGIATWVDEQMAGTAVVLHTAMDTRRDTATRTDPDNAGLADTDRLADDWVEGFETYGGDAQLDYSLLVVEADLPADVLVAVGDNHLGDHFGYDDRGSPGGSGLDSAGPPTTEADLNIAAAIAANPDASVGWLTGDGIAPGTDTVDLVLTTPDIAPDMYTAFADIVDTGLSHPTDDTDRGDLMKRTIRIVADDLAGADLYVPPPGTAPEDTENAADAMRHAFGNGAAANMDVLHGMVTDNWRHAVSGELPSDDALATHDFLRETMADEVAADRVAAGYVNYAVEQLGPDTLPEPGVDSSPGDLLDDRRERLQQIGTLEGTIVRAENNALIGSVEERIAEQQARGRSVNAGIDITAYIAGFIPVYGPVIGGIDTAADVAGFSVGDIFFPTDESALDAAHEDATARERHSSVNFATLHALANGSDSPPIDASDGVSDEERPAYESWLLENYYDGPAHDAMVAGFNQADVFEHRR